MKKFIEGNKEFESYQMNSLFKICFLIFIISFGNLNLQIYSNKIKTFEYLIKEHNNDFKINKPTNFDYYSFNFAIIRRTRSRSSGLFSDYKYFLGCLRHFLIQGFVPIIDLESYKNSINGFRIKHLKGNPWEYYFKQPFGYKYRIVKKKAKNIKYFECKLNWIIPSPKIFINKKSMNYWHNMAIKYVPIKKEIIKKSNNIINRIFNESRNILGVLLRGTDYITRKPKGHAIPPKTEDVIKDAKILDDKYKYDWIFLATEDNIIRQDFITAMGKKVKYLLNKNNITYNYTKKKLLAYNINFRRNINYHKIYLLNIIILSKCLDFLGAITSGTVGVFMITEGFRNSKVYNLGHYK